MVTIPAPQDSERGPASLDREFVYFGKHLGGWLIPFEVTAANLAMRLSPPGSNRPERLASPDFAEVLHECASLREARRTANTPYEYNAVGLLHLRSRMRHARMVTPEQEFIYRLLLDGVPPAEVRRMRRQRELSPLVADAEEVIRRRIEAATPSPPPWMVAARQAEAASTTTEGETSKASDGETGKAEKGETEKVDSPQGESHVNLTPFGEHATVGAKTADGAATTETSIKKPKRRRSPYEPLRGSRFPRPSGARNDYAKAVYEWCRDECYRDLRRAQKAGEEPMTVGSLAILREQDVWDKAAVPSTYENNGRVPHRKGTLRQWLDESDVERMVRRAAEYAVETFDPALLYRQQDAGRRGGEVSRRGPRVTVDDLLRVRSQHPGRTLSKKEEAALLECDTRTIQRRRADLARAENEN